MLLERPFSRAAATLGILVVVAAVASAEHAQTTLKYNPGQQGHANTYDTYVNRDAPTTNYNGNWYGHITRKNNNPADPPEKSTLVRFDLPSWVYDSSVTVHQAKLGLWVYQLVDLDQSYDWVYVGAYRINGTRDWVDSQATWNVFKGSTYWATAGCENTTWDRSGTADDTLIFTRDSAINRYYEWTVTGSVNAWKGGATNRGWIMRVPSYDGGPEEGISVNLTEGGVAYRPTLWLDWTQTPLADANGPYVCDYLGTVQIDGSGSHDRDAGAVVQWYWDLTGDGNYIDATGMAPKVTWDYLVNTLGLKPGLDHQIGLKVLDDDNEWSSPAFSSIYVAIPEPTSFAMLALGGLALIRRRIG
jgi:hypothetical protein